MPRLYLRPYKLNSWLYENMSTAVLVNTIINGSLSPYLSPTNKLGQLYYAAIRYNDFLLT